VLLLQQLLVQLVYHSVALQLLLLLLLLLGRV
jgi:hypothetical protein